MHTVLVLGVGLGLLGVSLLIGRELGGAAGVVTASLAFLPLWFIGASVNLYLGVKRAGYSLADEAPIFVLVFSIPAAVALLIWWRLR
jgi:hypothetical protein